MKAFFNLSQRGQIIRLRKLANAALQRYGIGEASLRFLSNTDNTVFRVDKIGTAGRWRTLLPQDDSSCESLVQKSFIQERR